MEHDGEAGAARLDSILDTAMRLYLGVPVELNECVEIALSPWASFRGNVVWVNGSNCGIAFEKRVNGAKLLPSAEVERHHPNGAETQQLKASPVGKGGENGPALASPDCGPHEMEILHGHVFVPGLRVKVLGGDQERSAVVRWSRENITELFFL